KLGRRYPGHYPRREHVVVEDDHGIQQIALCRLQRRDDSERVVAIAFQNAERTNRTANAPQTEAEVERPCGDEYPVTLVDRQRRLVVDGHDEHAERTWVDSYVAEQDAGE